jgi:hypothetical protein
MAVQLVNLQENNVWTAYNARVAYVDKNCFLYYHMKDAAVKNTTNVDLKK